MSDRIVKTIVLVMFAYVGIIMGGALYSLGHQFTGLSCIAVWGYMILDALRITWRKS